MDNRDLLESILLELKEINNKLNGLKENLNIQFNQVPSPIPINPVFNTFSPAYSNCLTLDFPDNVRPEGTTVTRVLSEGLTSTTFKTDVPFTLTNEVIPDKK